MSSSGRKPFLSPALAGVIAAVVIAALVSVMGWININFAAPWAHTHTLTAQVSDVDGIAVSSDVRIAGRLVGQVTKVVAKGDHAELTLHVDDAEWPLSADTSAVIRLATLLGQKYVELLPGTGGAHLADDGVIPLKATRPVVDFDQLLDTFDPPTRAALTGLIRTLGAGVQGEEGNLQQLIPGLRDLSVHGQAPTTTLAQHDADLNGILVNLGIVADQLNRSRDDVAGVIDNLNTVTGALAANPDALRGFIRNTDALAQTGHQVLGGPGAGQLATGLRQLTPVAGQFDRLLTSLLPQTQAFKQGGITPAILLINRIGDAISQSDRDGYFLRQNLLGLDCSGLLPAAACSVPTAPPAARTGPTAPIPLTPIPGPGGPGPDASPGPMLPPLLGGLLGDWWPSPGPGASLASFLDLWSAP